MKRKKYKYYLDWNGGTIIKDTLKDLCVVANEKFSHLESANYYDEFNAGYHKRNTFGKKYSRYSGNLIGDSFEYESETGMPYNEYDFTLGRYAIN